MLFEVAWVLGRYYKIGNDEVLDILEAVLSYPNLWVVDKELVIKAIALGRATGSDFADSYIAVSANNIKADNVATFNNKHFSKLGVTLYSLQG